MSKTAILGMGYYVPENRVTNDDLAQRFDTSDEWIRSHTGIGNRHIVSEDQSVSDLAYEASLRALADAGVKAEEIDMIILATAAPDYIGFPSTACVLQNRLGAINAGAFDIAAGCTGFIYGLEIARGMVNGTGQQRILVIGAETLSKITNWEDRSTCVLFGDGAGAAVVGPSNTGNGIIDSYIRSRGDGYDKLIRREGGSRSPYHKGDTVGEGYYLEMDGRAVYNFAVGAVKTAIEKLCENNQLDVHEDIDWIVPHQANERIIQAVSKRAKIPMEQFYLNIEEYANTSAATIPIALAEMQQKGLLKRGQKILTVGFGAGLTFGGNLIRW